ncbi:MAG: sodium-independent anion transporter [Pseudolabrys sp.]
MRAAGSDHIRRRISDLVEAAPAELQAVVIDCSIVPYIDTTAETALRVLARRLKGQGIAIALAELRDDVRENLKAIGAEQDLGPIAAHRSIEDCLPQRHPTQ